MIAIFLKETIILLRSRKAFWLMLVTVLLAGTILGLEWTDMAESGNIINRRATLGRSFFMFLSTVQLCMLGLIAPLLSATAITAERESKTFDLLICTRLSRMNLVLGKWLAAIFFQVMISLCLLPVTSLVFQLGGVDTDEYVSAAVITVLTVMTYGMVGLAFSCKSRKSRSALVATLGTILLLVFGIPAIFACMFAELVGPAVCATSPLLIWMIHQDRYMTTLSSGTFLTSGIFLSHVGCQVLIFMLALLSARKRLSRPLDQMTLWLEPGRPIPPAPAAPTPEPPPLPTPVIDPALLETLTAAAPPPEPPPLPADAPTQEAAAPPQPSQGAGQSKAIRDGQNPVLAKEINFWCREHSAAISIMGLLFFLVSTLVGVAVINTDSRSYVAVQGCTLIALLGLALPILAAPAISREREENTMDLLRTLPLSPFQIVQGKFFAVLRLGLIFFASVLIIPSLLRMLLSVTGDLKASSHGDPSSLFGDFFLPTTQYALPIVAFMALIIALSLFFSSGQRRASAALLQTYLGLGAIVILPMPLMSLLDGFPPLRFLLPLINPFFYFCDGMDSSESLRVILAYVPSRAPLASLAMTGVHAALVGFIVYALLRAAARRMARAKE